MTYQYREFPVPGFFLFEISEPVSEQICTGKKSRNWCGKNLAPGKSLVTGIGKNSYRRKVSEPVSEKSGTGKKSHNRYQKNLVPEKVSEPVSKKIGTESLEPV